MLRKNITTASLKSEIDYFPVFSRVLENFLGRELHNSEDYLGKCYFTKTLRFITFILTSEH